MPHREDAQRRAGLLREVIRPDFVEPELRRQARQVQDCTEEHARSAHPFAKSLSSVQSSSIHHPIDVPISADYPVGTYMHSERLRGHPMPSRAYRQWSRVRAAELDEVESAHSGSRI